MDLTWFTPSLQGQINPTAIKEPVINLTSQLLNQWTDPYDGTVWGVWDQVQRIDLDQESVTQASQFQFSDYFSFTEHFDADIAGESLFGLFTAGAEFREFFEYGIQLNASMQHVSGTVDAYIASLFPIDQLSPDEGFLKQAEELPTQWWDSEAYSLWLSHFDQFGTHFISTAKTGGDFHYRSFCDSAYIYEYDSLEAAEQAQVDFMHLLSVDGAVSDQTKMAESTYYDSCTVTVDCYGGNTLCNTGDSDTYATWVDSVHSNPWLLQMTYTANSQLLSSLSLSTSTVDSSATLQSTYADATTAYAAWAGLKVLQTMCDAALDRFNQLLSDYDSSSEFDNGGPANYATKSPDNLHSDQVLCVPTPMDQNDQCIKYFGPTLNTFTAWENGRSAAKKYAEQTQQVCSAIQDTLNTQRTDARVSSWLGSAQEWAAQVNDYLTRAYSYSLEYRSRAARMEGEFCCCGAGASHSLPTCVCDYGWNGVCDVSVSVPVGLMEPPLNSTRIRRM